MGHTPAERKQIFAEADEQTAARRRERFAEIEADVARVRGKLRARQIWAEDNGLTIEELEEMIRSAPLATRITQGLVRGATQ